MGSKTAGPHLQCNRSKHVFETESSASSRLTHIRVVPSPKFPPINQSQVLSQPLPVQQFFIFEKFRFEPPVLRNNEMLFVFSPRNRLWHQGLNGAPGNPFCPPLCNLYSTGRGSNRLTGR